eukprot:gene11819-24768_t
MICSEAIIDGDVQIGADSIIHPTCKILASEGNSVTIGERNIIEERCHILDSSLEHGNLIEVGVHITNAKASIGSFNRFNPKCIIKGKSQIGNYCIIGAQVVLEGNIIPDNTAVMSSNSGFITHQIDVKTSFAVTEAYRIALSDPNSPQCMSKHHEMR